MMSTNNKELFYKLVRAGLWEDTMVHDPRFTVHDFEQVDWNEVYRLAEEQSVIGLVLAGIERANVKPPQVLLLQWIGEIQILEQQNKAMNLFIAELIEKLQEAGIYTLLVKGQGVALCYEKPLWRVCGDVDLYLNDSNYKKAKKTLLPLASFVEEEKKPLRHLAITIDSWVVELHGSLRSKWLPRSVNKMIDQAHYNTFYSGEVRAWDNNNTIVYLPAPQNDILYVFAHFLEHFFVGGVGLRQICDWCRLLWSYRGEIDRTLLERSLKDGGLLSEWKTFAALAVDYLGMPSEAMPLYDPDKQWKNKATKALSIVMKSGNLGHNKDATYTERHSYIVSKLISFWNHIIESIRLFPLFPLDASIVWLKLLWGRLGALLKGK